MTQQAVAATVAAASPAVLVAAAPVAQTAGAAAQDYRASLARAARRRDAGEDVAKCPGCAAEVDVEAPAHSPRCSATVRVVAAAEQTRSKHTKEKGRDGRMRSTAERNAEGELTSGEMQRRHDAHLDAQPTVARCALCSWVFEGTAAECRDAAAAHRSSEHPGVGNGKRRGVFAAPKPEPAPEPKLDLAAETVVDIDEDRNEGLVDENVSTNGDSQSAARNGKARWDRESVIAAIRTWASVHGAPPTSRMWFTKVDGHDHPLAGTVKRIFGSWADAVVAAGFPRPTRGGAGRRKTRKDTSTDFPRSSGREPLAATPPVETAASATPRLPELRAPSPEPTADTVDPGSRPDEPAEAPPPVNARPLDPLRSRYVEMLIQKAEAQDLLDPDLLDRIERALELAEAVV